MPKHKELLSLYTNSFHSLPLKESDGTRVPYDEVVNLLDTETVDYGIAFGSAMSEQLEVSIKVDKDKYKEAIVWLRKLLFASEFSVDRYVFCFSETGNQTLMFVSRQTAHYSSKIASESPIGKARRA